MPELKKLNLTQPQPSTPSATPTTSVPTQAKPSSNKSLPLFNIGLILVVILFGLGAGWGIARLTPPSASSMSSAKGTKISDQAQLAVGDVFGVEDESTFSDTAEGIIVKGGIKGEGTHHLVRPGGDDQNVYLTSSVVDLDQLVDQKVKVWGQTFTAQTAGWLMDVGKVKILEINPEMPQ